jgi:hypothetical protein
MIMREGEMLILVKPNGDLDLPGGQVKGSEETDSILGLDGEKPYFGSKDHTILNWLFTFRSDSARVSNLKHQEQIGNPQVRKYPLH